jgi:hypothetical protein
MIKGSKQSEEAKEKIRRSRIGKSSWNKGITPSDETKEKMRTAKLGKQMSDEFKERRKQIMQEKWKDPEFKKQMSEKHSGFNNVNFGKKMSIEQRKALSIAARNRGDSWKEKQSISHTGKKDTDDTRLKKSQSHAGDKCYNWKGGITALNVHLRNISESKRICADVMKECNYTDHFTHIRGGVLACHHIIPQNIIIQMYKITNIEEARKCPLLFDKHNLIVMLASAHDKFHNLYGDNHNIYELTPEQIQELYA